MLDSSPSTIFAIVVDPEDEVLGCGQALGTARLRAQLRSPKMVVSWTCSRLDAVLPLSGRAKGG